MYIQNNYEKYVINGSVYYHAYTILSGTTFLILRTAK